MNYQEFVNQIKETLSDMYENTYKIIVNPVKKLNGVEYDGLVVCNPNRNISPTIYLNLYYHRYLDGVPFDEIISDIVTTVEEHMPKSDFDISTFTDFNKAKEPFYTTKPDQERSGMGFAVMESFMDNLELKNNMNHGLIVKMQKFFKHNKSMAVAE